MNLFREKGGMAGSKKKTYEDESQVFTTAEFIESLQKINPDYGERKAYRTLENLQKRGRITKVSRGHYTFKITKQVYTYKPDRFLKSIIRKIEKQVPKCDFQIWQLSQFNEFLSRELSYNAVFVEVQHGYEECVSDLLRSESQLVLRSPSATSFHRYRTDNVIVVKRLYSDCPGPQEGTHLCALEKLIVDLFSTKLTGSLIERNRYEEILEDAFSRCAINEKALFRYARRRSLEKEIRRFIDEETLIHLMI